MTVGTTTSPNRDRLVSVDTPSKKRTYESVSPEEFQKREKKAETDAERTQRVVVRSLKKTKLFAETPMPPPPQRHIEAAAASFAATLTNSLPNADTLIDGALAIACAVSFIGLIALSPQKTVAPRIGNPNALAEMVARMAEESGGV